MSLTLQDLKLEILRSFAGARSHGCHKYNLLGRTHQSGGLESSLGITFDKEQRGLAAQAFEELKRDGLIRSTHSDVVDPENWCEITDAGRDAIQHGTLDDLDRALQAIDPHLVQIRRGARAALASSQPDSLRQAAHSGRELIDQVLKEGAPDTDIKAQENFRADPNSRSSVTRRMRVKFLMEKQRGRVSDGDLKIIEKACDLVEAVDDKLKATAHGRTVPSQHDVRDALDAAEIALRRILLSPYPA